MPITELEAYKFQAESAEGCDSINTAGSIIRFAPLLRCGGLPTLHQLTPAAAAIGDTVVTANITGPLPLVVGTTLYFKAGDKITFGTSTVTVAADTTVTSTAAPIQVDTLTAAILPANIAETFGTVALLDPTDLSENDNDTTQDTSSIPSFIGSMTIVRKNPQINLTLKMRDEADIAYHGKGFLYDAKSQAKSLFTIVADSAKYVTWGVMLPMNHQKPRQNGNFITAQVTLAAQSKWSTPRHYDLLEVAEKATVDKVLQYSGLSGIYAA
ncbi:MAG: hypothetical protein ACRC4X_05365 [Cetobacterium sp.]